MATATQQARTEDTSTQGRINGRDTDSKAEQQSEGIIAKTIEEQTAKLPSDLFLWAAVGSIAGSAVLEFMGHKDKSRFVGQWVAPFLLFGVYNKLVKQQGSDRTEN